MLENDEQKGRAGTGHPFFRRTENVCGDGKGTMAARPGDRRDSGPLPSRAAGSQPYCSLEDTVSMCRDVDCRIRTSDENDLERSAQTPRWKPYLCGR